MESDDESDIQLFSSASASTSSSSKGNPKQKNNNNNNNKSVSPEHYEPAGKKQKCEKDDIKEKDSEISKSLTSLVTDETDQDEAGTSNESSWQEKQQQQQQQPGHEQEDIRLRLEELGLNSWLVSQCRSLGLRHPTPVQSNCIPEILKGRDVIGCAKTGSGKTAAFALPLLQLLFEDPYGIFGVVLTPTRELAKQIADQFRVFGQPAGVKVVEVVGGMEMLKQSQQLHDKPHIIVATPGRLADHLDSSESFHLQRIKILVMDEADRLLDDDTAFPEQLQLIFKHMPPKRQTLLFSATLNETIMSLKESALTNPFFWKAKSEVATVDQLDQRYVLVPAQVKEPNLIQIVKEFQEEKPLSNCIIFTKTCRTCQILSRLLTKCGFSCAALHSMMNQKKRFDSLHLFKSKQTKILVATDVASRGLDIPTVDLVVNFDLPTQPKVYVHRVGRTARAGRGGKALTIITEHDIKLLHAIEGLVNVRLTEHKVNEKEVMANLVKINVAKKTLEVRLESSEFGKRKEKRQINRKKKRMLEEKE